MVPPGWSIGEVEGINDKGQIVAQASKPDSGFSGIVILTPPQCTGCYFLNQGTRATLAFNLSNRGGAFSYNYRNATTNIQFVSTQVIPGGISGNTTWFSGQGKLNGQPGYSFSVIATDGGPAGSGLDAISITIAGPNNYSYTVTGVIAGGDIIVTP